MTSEGQRSGAAKKGEGFFPPNPKQWGNERNGLRLREDLGIGLAVRLSVRDAFTKLNGHVEVWRSSEVACAKKYSDLLHGLRSSAWSAFASPCPDGAVVVIFNETHAKQRRRATLMEEFFHLRLGHPPSTIRFTSGGDARRTFKSVIEEEAYCSGAAALVPYKGLRFFLDQGRTSKEIAEIFDVSEQLLEFRAKVTKLYKRIRS
jgi:Zn-dependent peptidase ImmA (M78 family)